MEPRTKGIIRELRITIINLAPQKSLLPSDTMSQSAEPVIPDESDGGGLGRDDEL